MIAPGGVWLMTFNVQQINIVDAGSQTSHFSLSNKITLNILPGFATLGAYIIARVKIISEFQNMPAGVFLVGYVLIFTNTIFSKPSLIREKRNILVRPAWLLFSRSAKRKYINEGIRK